MSPELRLRSVRRVDSKLSGGTGGSAGSHRSARSLYRDIPSCEPLTGSGSFRLNTTGCNVVDSTSPAFTRFWDMENCRNAFLSQLDKQTLLNIRLASPDFASKAAPHVFNEVTVNFGASSFKPVRVAALERIGHHVRSFVFRMAYSKDTLLPPLVDRTTGEQRWLIYTPEAHGPDRRDRKAGLLKYGKPGDMKLAIQQYPPVFHAATRVGSFNRVLCAMPFLSHLRIDCSGQGLPLDHHQTAVNYALTSLRIAVEVAPPLELQSLSIAHVHPVALYYLNPTVDLRSTPEYRRRWAQIKDLSIDISSVAVQSRPEHLHNLHSYVYSFSGSITRLSFHWIGQEKGPSPLLIERDPSSSSTLLKRQPPYTSSLTRSDGAIQKPTFPKLRNIILKNSDFDSRDHFIKLHREHLHKSTDIRLLDGDQGDAVSSVHTKDKPEGRKLDPEIVTDSPFVLLPVEDPRLSRKSVIIGPLDPREKFRMTTPNYGHTSQHHRSRDKRGRARRKKPAGYVDGLRKLFDAFGWG